jgi:hypothetical protein
MVVILALTLTICGCACLYLASPNQQWLSRNLARKPLLAVACVLLAAGLAAWIVALCPLPGVFVTLYVAIVCLMAFPYAAALRVVWRRN